MWLLEQPLHQIMVSRKRMSQFRIYVFFAVRTGHALRTEHQLADGVTVPYISEHQRQCFSNFRKLAFWRLYFYRNGSGGATPLDQEIGGTWVPTRHTCLTGH